MSEMYDYIFLKDKKVNDVDVEAVITTLDLEEHKFVGEKLFRGMGIVRDLWIGGVNNGVIIIGYCITNSIIHDIEIRNNFFKQFSDCEIYAKAYDDRVMAFGYLLAKNGEIISVREGGESDYSEGSSESLEKELITDSEDNDIVTCYKLMQELEKKYLGKAIDDFDNGGINLKIYEKS